MLNNEQKEILAQAEELYIEGKDLSIPIKQTSIDALQKAFDLLWPHLPEVAGACEDDPDNSIYFKVVLANVIQTLQDAYGRMDTDYEVPVAVRNAKEELYRDIADFSLQFADIIVERMYPYFWKSLSNFALDILSCSPSEQSFPYTDNLAKALFDTLRFLEWPRSETIFLPFAKVEGGGWAFVGDRPKRK